MATESRREARARIDAELMAAARGQLAEVGAAGLSLRAVARDIGMVSSAVYRYVESRDALLTRMIIEAYDAVGEAAEEAAAASARSGDLDRWVRVAQAIRRWAHAHPHEYLLLYGSPVPGYAAPDTTVDPGTRVTRALASVLGDAVTAERLAPLAYTDHPVDAGLADELAGLADQVMGGVEPERVLAFLVAWTQVFGLVSFELTNQTRGLVESHAVLFDEAVRRSGHQMGLR